MDKQSLNELSLDAQQGIKMHTSELITLLLIMLLLFISMHALAQDEFAGFPEPQAAFQEHIVEVQRYLLGTQMSQRSAADVQYNLPFERKASTDVSYRGKFLLIHGLNDSPYVFTDVATALVKRGFDVRAILLPGHGSTPKAQLNITAERWLNAAREHLALWHQDNTVPMYLGGFSMGAVIATTMALETENIAGLLLFSPAYKSRMNHMLRWASLYSRFKPWVFGGMIIEDNPTKYNSIPINGAAQYYKLAQILKKRLRTQKLEMPILAVASVDDSVVDVGHFIQVFSKKFTSPQKRLILYSNTQPYDEVVSTDYRKSAFPDLRILNQSHQGVIVAPDNPLFGTNGRVLVCNGNDWPTFSACLYSTQRHWYGAQHTQSPDEAPVARTTYNPDFFSVFEAFDAVFR